ncbi:MAG TPA: glycoside hydrolase family 15 protein, partial [Gemmatimonadaceae bacterium]|nr:glycoside hydrolase family 15 protein [Gemmatimonadaceae bacterium]
MPRDLPLSNGRLLVAFDRDYLIRDIYFPHVGKENHATGHAFRLGVWVDHRFSWMGKDWGPDMRYADESMATDVKTCHEALGISLSCEDAVDFYENVLVRHVTVRNEANRAREIRIFFHHDFRIGGTEVGDTAFYDPETRSLIHYKDDRYFLMNCIVDGEVGIPRYACGAKEVGGAEGTWRDAEDGQLSGNPIAQGSVDSTAGVPLQVAAKGTGEFYYWMAAGTHYREVATVNQVVRDKTPDELLRRTRNYWHLWVGKDRRHSGDLSERAVQRYQQSLLIIRSQIDHTGAVIAANDTDITRIARDTYSYMWPRDGALVSAALMRAGHAGAAEAFLEFCAEHISPNGYMRHKYNPDGTLASSWHGYVRDGRTIIPIQEDETALVVWALWQYFELFRRIEETAPFYRTLVTRPADFMLKFVDPRTGLPLPSHDLWEERWGVHAYTVATVIAGLRAAAHMSEAFGETERASRYVKGAERMLEGLRTVLWNEDQQRFARMASPTPEGYTLDMTLDSSLFSLAEFGTLAPDDPQLESTLRQVAKGLWVNTQVGGLARYENDYYHQVETQDTARVPGNPWFISTMWLARYHVSRAANPEELLKAHELIEWAAARALPSGTMAEQLHPYTGEPLSVSPLTWSHAAYVTAVRDYLDRANRLNLCPTCHQPLSR